MFPHTSSTLLTPTVNCLAGSGEPRTCSNAANSLGVSDGGVATVSTEVLDADATTAVALPAGSGAADGPATGESQRVVEPDIFTGGEVPSSSEELEAVTTSWGASGGHPSC